MGEKGWQGKQTPGEETEKGGLIQIWEDRYGKCLDLIIFKID